MADYQDVQVARRITRLINGPDFTLINGMVLVLVAAMVIVGVYSIF